MLVQMLQAVEAVQLLAHLKTHKSAEQTARKPLRCAVKIISL